MLVKVSGLVWLPLKDLTERHIDNIRQQLTIQPAQTTTLGSKDPPKPIHLYKFDTKNGMIGIPRGYYLKNASGKHEEQVEVSYGAPMAKLKTNYTCEGPFREQGDILNLFEEMAAGVRWGGFFLKAGCGSGKTSIALEFARRMGRRTLILVHQEFFLNQWRDRIKQLMPDAKVGVIRQSKCEIDGNDFVIGMLQTIARDVDGGRFEQGTYDKNFGMVIVDEAHRMGAASFAGIVPRFNAAWRLCLSATPRRLDGAQDVFFYHVSDITYDAKIKAMTPGIRILRTAANLKPIARGQYRVDISDLNSAQILTQLGEDRLRSKDIVDQVLLAVKAGRKVMVVSERIQHLKDMADMLNDTFFTLQLPFRPTVDFYTGEWYSGKFWETKSGKHKAGDPKMIKRTEEDLKKAESANVIMATKQMVAEGLDIQALDVLVLSTPMSDVEQASGRVRRWCKPDTEKCKRLCAWRAGVCEGKPDPIIVDVVDERISVLVGKWNRRRAFYKTIGAEV